MQSKRPTNRPLSRLALASLIALQVVALGVAGSLGPQSVAAGVNEETAATRTHWQEQYRRLLRNRATLEANIAKSDHDYAQAQRRNYPRGGAREKYRLQSEAASADLARTKQEIATLFEDARRAGVPPGWLYEVEDETIEATQPASADGNPDDAADREGRNPLYLEDDEDDS